MCDEWVGTNSFYRSLKRFSGRKNLPETLPNLDLPFKGGQDWREVSKALRTTAHRDHQGSFTNKILAS